MRICIALFRGINVGGRNVLPMKDLVSLLEDLGARDVRTYIQSGNAVFRIGEPDAGLLSDGIQAEVGKRHGFEPRVLVLDLDALQRAAASNPFPEAESEPKTLHLFFLAEPPEDPDLDALEAVRGDSERFSLGNGVFYLHTPDGFGRSKLAERAERLLGVPATGRNWRTVHKVLDLARECESGA